MEAEKEVGEVSRFLLQQFTNPHYIRSTGCSHVGCGQPVFSEEGLLLQNQINKKFPRANMNWKRIPKVLHNITFEVSGDPDWTPYHLMFTPVVEKAIEESSEAMRDKSAGNTAAQSIRQFIRQYPRFPMFKNHLFTYYYLRGETVAAQQVIDECLQAHPDYFYNGIMQATLWMRSDTDRPKLPVLMRGWNIIAYAGRNKFVEHEVRGYYLLAAEYYLWTMQVDQADGFVYFLEAASPEPDHPNIGALRKKVTEVQKLMQKARGYWVKKDK